MWHLVCTYCGQVVLIFPGVVNAFRRVPERGEMGFSWKGLGNEPLIFWARSLSSPDLPSFFRLHWRIHCKNNEANSERCPGLRVASEERRDSWLRSSANAAETLSVPHHAAVRALTLRSYTT